MDSAPNVHPKMNTQAGRPRRWSDAERRFVSQHRMDGYVLISEGLRGAGFDRTPHAVRMFAAREMGLRLAKYPAGGMTRCVECGRWYARPNTKGGREGFCPTCWKRRQLDAMREGAAERAAAVEYDNEKHALRRVREGTKGDGRRR